ncbi:MAG: hypothetical protein R3F43_19205 [bacterium]
MPPLRPSFALAAAGRVTLADPLAGRPEADGLRGLLGRPARPPGR